jgi:hypothetical protein
MGHLIPTVRLLLAASLLLAGCGPASEPKGTLTMTVTPAALDADGVSYALVEVGGTSVGKVTIRSNRGSFEGLGAIVFFNQAPFSTMLVTCDSRTDATCAGLVTISASDESLASAQGVVRFRPAP